VLAAVSAVTMGLYYVYETNPRIAATSFEIRTEIAASFLLVSAGYFLVKHRVAPYVRPWMPLLALGLAVPGYLPHAHWWVSAIVSPLARNSSGVPTKRVSPPSSSATRLQ